MLRSSEKREIDENRYERKFCTTRLTKHEIAAILIQHPAMFSEIHPRRSVNNIYFDTLTMDNYQANVVGLASRQKCRIRWYGHLFGPVAEPILQLKIKKGLLGRKEQIPLEPFSLVESFRGQTIVEVFKRSKMQDGLRSYLEMLTPVLLNRYQRRYFLSADSNYRITLDTDMEFFGVGDGYHSIARKWVDEVTTIVELKYSQDKDRSAQQISNSLPFRLSRSSKYVKGIRTLSFQ